LLNNFLLGHVVAEAVCNSVKIVPNNLIPNHRENGFQYFLNFEIQLSTLTESSEFSEKWLIICLRKSLPSIEKHLQSHFFFITYLKTIVCSQKLKNYDKRYGTKNKQRNLYKANQRYIISQFGKIPKKLEQSHTSVFQSVHKQIIKCKRYKRNYQKLSQQWPKHFVSKFSWNI